MMSGSFDFFRFEVERGGKLRALPGHAVNVEPSAQGLHARTHPRKPQSRSYKSGAADGLGIKPLAIVGDVNSQSVAEHTLMLMLTLAKRTLRHDGATRSGDWTYRNKFDAFELSGKQLLLLGFGRIGRKVAMLAKAFGMRVVASRRRAGTISPPWCDCLGM